MRITLLVVGSVLAFGVFMATALTGIGASDRDGRVPMPGEKALQLEAGEYSVYYEEPHGTSDNQVFEPPDGIRVRVRGLRGAPDPELERGGIGNQVGTDNRTAETIGLLKVEEDGPVRSRGRSSAGRPAAITIGEKASASFVRGAKYAGLVLGGTALLFLLVSVAGRVRRRSSGPAWESQWSSAATVPGAAHAPAGGDRLEQLERLSALHRSGVITVDEFERAKRQLLS